MNNPLSGTDPSGYISAPVSVSYRNRTTSAHHGGVPNRVVAATNRLRRQLEGIVAAGSAAKGGNGATHIQQPAAKRGVGGTNGDGDDVASLNGPELVRSDVTFGDNTRQKTRGEGPEWRVGLGKELLPEGSEKEQENLERTVWQGYSVAASKRKYFNSPEANKSGSAVATIYDGADVGAYVEEKFSLNFFGEDDFQLRRSLEGQYAGINQPHGYAIRGSGGSADFAKGGVVVTVVAPTPHRNARHRPSSTEYTAHVRRSAHIYIETANRTKAPVVVVSPTDVYIFRGDEG